MEFQTAYHNHRKQAFICKGPSRTKQAPANECDINTIMKKFETEGILPRMIQENPQYGDYSEVPDYQTALNILQKTQEQFNALDLELRNRFENDPAKFLAFATDIKNKEEMRKLGLLKPEAPAPQTPPVPPVPPTEVKK